MSDAEAGEAWALHTIAELVRGSWPGQDRAVRGQISRVLDAAAIELNAGRALPIEVRRAVLGLADALRVSMDPRKETGSTGTSAT